VVPSGPRAVVRVVRVRRINIRDTRVKWARAHHFKRRRERSDQEKGCCGDSIGFDVRLHQFSADGARRDVLLRSPRSKKPTALGGLPEERMKEYSSKIARPSPQRGLGSAARSEITEEPGE